ncbi:DEBR0S3_04214g1_1 [Brettanomyces bruxellensis]|uniref:S-formylglutathione hydrolase n=1 Tax=Dekkera bruxellensis TaxID=5007 RepID=A0A7D9GZM0_DEKBR|nr:DEBR0S3_04214g1_1 [Brettanomyces bruxellensis]
MIFTTNESIASFGGKMLKLSHESPITDSKMQLNLYLPHQYFDPEHKEPLPVLLFFSGLTSTPDNISEKGYIEPYANKYGLAVLLPDTSPRLEDPKFKDGNGAGFYVDATTDPWSKHFKMYSYILKDLIPSIGKEFSKLNIQRMSICGHSMGGFGAIMIYLRNPNRFKSCSGFAPLTHPKGCFNGKKYFTQYLGPDESKWDQYDPCDLIKTFDGQKTPILIHQGKGRSSISRSIYFLKSFWLLLREPKWTDSSIFVSSMIMITLTTLRRRLFQNISSFMRNI